VPYTPGTIPASDNTAGTSTGLTTDLNTAYNAMRAMDAGLTSTVPRTATRAVGQDELVVNVKDRGAIGDGTTDDTTAIQGALTAAASSGMPVMWPAGTYLTTATLTDLHTVRHVGPGAIKRGTDTFYPDPRGSQTSILYVATTGADTNDGLSATQPFLTFGTAFTALKNYGPVLDGLWEIVAAAGTYPHEGTGASMTTRSVNRVVIRGPVAGHPNVPTAIIDGTGGAAYEHGLRVGGVGVRVELRDLKATNFTAGGGDLTRIGFVAENEVDAYFNNVHATGATWCGAYAFNTVRARVAGGIFDGCRSGFIANDTQCTVDGSIVRNSTASGVYWSRGSQGHVDNVAFEDNVIGLRVAENSRVDTVANNFKRNTYGIQTQTGGLFGEGGTPNIFNDGTADAQVQANIQRFAGSGDSIERETVTDYVRVGHDRTTRTLTGTTTQTTLSTVYTLPARRLAVAGSQMRVHVLGIFTATTAGSVLTVTIGGMSTNFTVPGATTNAAFEIDLTLLEVTGGWRAIGRLSQGLNQQRFATAASGFDPTVANAVVIKATPAASGDSLAVYRTDVYVLG